MNTYDVTIGANGVFDLIGRGRFLRLMTSTGPVDIEYYGAGRVIARSDGVEAGYAEEFDGQGFDRVRVSADPGVTIKAVIRDSGRVAYDRGATAADVLSMPPVVVSALPALKREPAASGNALARASLAGVAVQLVSPSANVNGMVIRRAALRAPSGQYAMLMAAVSAPSGVGDVNAEILIAADQGSEVLPYEMNIAQGIGLYAIGSGGSNVSAAYELL